MTPTPVEGGNENCDYYERHGLIAEERGDPVSHVDACTTCHRRQRQILRLRQLLAALPDPVSDLRWELAVWSEVATRQQRRERRRRLAALMALPLAATALILITTLSFHGKQRPATSPSLPPLLAFASHLERGDGRVIRSAAEPRGQGRGAAGDLLVLEASGLTGDFAEMRLYQQDIGLVLRCATEDPCERKGSTLRLRWRLPAVGRYRAILLWGAGPPPAPTGSEDEDMAGLRRLGVQWREVEQIVN
jgi:hypothetical protein